jgi:hypothetical protein
MESGLRIASVPGSCCHSTGCKVGFRLVGSNGEGSISGKAGLIETRLLGF